MARRRKRAGRQRRQARKATRRSAKSKRQVTRQTRRQTRLDRKDKRKGMRADRRERRLEGKDRRQELRMKRRDARLEGKLRQQEEKFAPEEEEINEISLDELPKEEAIEELEQEQELPEDEFIEDEEVPEEEEAEEETYEDWEYLNRRKRKGDGLRNLGAFALLAPFLPIMKGMLIARGYGKESGMNPATIATMFHKHIVKGETYEGQTHYEHFTGAVASGIVKGIITFIKNLKGKQKAGEELSAGEEKILNVADDVNKQTKELKRQQTESTIGEMFSKYWWVLIVIFILWYANKK